LENKPNKINPLVKKLILPFGAFVVLATTASQLVSWNEADERLVHQSAFTGDLKVIEQAGPYLKAFGTSSPYKKVISINFTGDEGATASAIVPLIPIRFLDTTTGDQVKMGVYAGY